MGQTGYIISDASKQLEVEPYVLRYWEEELELVIPRNTMGHRYYGEKELATIRGIKRLKEQGFQLKAIKLVLPNIEKVEKLPEDARQRLCNELNERVTEPEQEKNDLILHGEVQLKRQEEQPVDKMNQFQSIMTKIIQSAIQESNKDLCKELSKAVSTSVVKEVDYQFRRQEERQEIHYRKIDEAIRNCQRKKKRKGIFQR
ncbi:MAG: MerR family transcriptional regulator [Lachnospiraceae bacterium]|nr:MerR family transcriptional regulator [Lachnospiraceae bacterium]